MKKKYQKSSVFPSFFDEFNQKDSLKPFYILEDLEDTNFFLIENHFKDDLGFSSLSSSFSPPLVIYDDGDTLEEADILNECQSFSFEPMIRVILVRYAKKIKWSELLLDYVQSPMDQVSLILVSPDKRDKMVKKALLQACRVSCDMDDINFRKKWICETFDSAQIQYDHSVIFSLSSIKNLSELRGLLEILVIYGLSTYRIHVEDVDIFKKVSENESTLFHYVDYVANQDIQKAIDFVVLFMERQGSSAIELIGLLIWHFHQMWDCRLRLDKGLTWQQVVTVKKIGWQKTKMKQQLDRYFKKGDQSLRKIWFYLLEKEKRMKTLSPSCWKEEIIAMTIELGTLSS